MVRTAQAEQRTHGMTLPRAWRIEVHRRHPEHDPEGAALAAAARDLGHGSVARVRTAAGYLLPPEIDRAAVERIGRELLSDPVLDELRLVAPGREPESAPGVQRLLVAKKPGVMDPVALTVRRALVRTRLWPAAAAEGFHVATYRAVGIEARPPLARAALAEIGARLLANETVDDLSVESEALSYGVPPPRPAHGARHVALGDATDHELARISERGALSLSLLEMRAIRDHYRAERREPTICELETLAQTWSEHCKHKTFRGVVDFDGRRIDNLLKATIQRVTLELARPWCVSVFHDNAGIVAFEDGWDVCFKVETHNHPSALDPYGGAGTGVGGVVRDVLGVGLGARPIANTDAFFVGPTDLPRDAVPRGTLHPARVLAGVVAGVRDYGNRMGIPTVGGGVWEHPGYTTNPLVFCGTVGLIPHAAAHKSVAAGDAVVVVGGRTGRDGIHGATFSSVELSEESEVVSGAAVQIGDAITEKRVQDALLQAQGRGLYRAITDCGAGGLSSAVGEMASETGAEVDLERVPLKYPGLAPEEVWISEAQERMVLAVPPERVDELVRLFASEDVEATAIGRFTASGRLVLRWHGETVGDLDLDFLHEGTPRPVRRATWSPPRHADPGAPPAPDHGRVLLDLLALPDVRSKEWIVRQYDHEVQGMSVVKPLVGPAGSGPGDAAVLQPLAGSRRGIALGCGVSARYGELDPGAMAEAVVDEALRNVVAVGGDPARTAILDNFAWGNCEKPDRLGALVLAAEGCARAALAYGAPFISGKDSLNNEYRVGEETRSIPPTLLVSALAIVPDVARAATMDAKRAGSLLYLVGATRPELGGSQYLARLGLAGGRVPRPDLERAPGILAGLHRAIAGGHVLACHDLSEGGLAVAAAEMAFAGGLGMEIDLGAVGLATAGDSSAEFDPDSARLYAESTTRFLVEVAEGSVEAFEKALGRGSSARIGRIEPGTRFRVKGVGGAVVIDVEIEALARAHRGPAVA